MSSSETISIVVLRERKALSEQRCFTLCPFRKEMKPFLAAGSYPLTLTLCYLKLSVIVSQIWI